MPLQRIGDWEQAGHLLPGLAKRLANAQNKALLQVAHLMRKEMIEAFSNQGTPGRPWAPLSPLTLAIRRFKGGTGSKGTKILQVTGSLRNSIQVIKSSDSVFIGIKRSATTKDGKSLINIGMVHEFGATVQMTVTAKMRRFLAAAMKAAGLERRRGGGGGGGGNRTVTIHIPPRPFIGPIVEAWVNDPDRMERELTTRIAAIMEGDVGRP